MFKMDRNFGRYRLTFFWKTSAPSYGNMCHQLHKNAPISYLKFVKCFCKINARKSPENEFKFIPGGSHTW